MCKADGWKLLGCTVSEGIEPRKFQRLVGQQCPFTGRQNNVKR